MFNSSLEHCCLRIQAYSSFKYSTVGVHVLLAPSSLQTTSSGSTYSNSVEELRRSLGKGRITIASSDFAACRLRVRDRSEFYL
jgi:hypothetical protein